MRHFARRSFEICLFAVSYLCVSGNIAQAQVTPDNTVDTNVNQNGNVSEITGGQTRGDNLFHSFQDFSVPTGNEAFFDNADTIENVFSRVTGGNISNIDGLIRANGSASLFLVNPAGIIFGQNASLNIGGSFIGSSADSILFPDGVEFSASDTQAQPVLTVNAPIGLGFRDNPGDLVNRANFLDDGGTPDDPADDDLIGLRVTDDNTIGLIGGNVLIDSGSVSSTGGRIEIGSVAGNNTVSLTEVAEGWDIGYEGVTNFQDINLTASAFVESFDENTGDIEIQGRNISLLEGSQIAINSEVGQAGNISVIASESLTINSNGASFPSQIIENIKKEATGAGSQISIDTPQLSLINGGQITTRNLNTGNGADIVVNSPKIQLDKLGAILAQAQPDATGNGGNITIETSELIVNGAGQVSTATFGAGNAGDIIVDAAKSIELSGTTEFPIPGTNQTTLRSSKFSASVGSNAQATGNGGNIITNSPRLIIADGAEIASVSRNQGNGGNITINAPDSILLTGTSPLIEFRGTGRSLITVGVEPAFETPSGETIFNTGKGGQLNINTGELTIAEGAAISANTLSLGDGGNIDIDADKLIVRNGGQIGAGSLLNSQFLTSERGQGGNITIKANDLVEIVGQREIDGRSLISRIFTLTEGTGTAGDLTLNTNRLTIEDGGDIDSRGIGAGTAGNLILQAQAANLSRGEIIADTGTGQGGNITFSIADNLVLKNSSSISARATGNANGGNISINSGLTLAFPSQVGNNGNDIIASAEQGQGGRINITTDSLLGLEEREAIAGNGTNDIDASSRFGLNGSVNITILDVDNIEGFRELPSNVVEPEQTTAQVCQSQLASQRSGLTVTGRGGIPIEPVAPLSIENLLLIDGNVVSNNREYQEAEATIHSTSKEIVLAQGVEITEDGQILLVAHKTENTPRVLDNSANCISSDGKL